MAQSISLDTALHSIGAVLKDYPGEPSQRPERLSQEQIGRISELLARAEKIAWSRIPRIFAVLYMIKRVEAIDAFVADDISDLWFPFAQQTLPDGLSSGRDRENFLELQSLILTSVLDLEREDGQHHNFRDADEVPLQRLAELGKGGYGAVDKVQSTITYRVYARKRIARGKTYMKNAQALRDFVRELHSLKKLRHVHIVQLVGSYTVPKFVCILISPVADANLKTFLTGNLTDNHKSLIRTFFGCLATAVQYLHESYVRHKDIKPQNILVKNDRVFLTDFGISLDWSDSGQSTTTGVTPRTPRYSAPEVAHNLSRNTASDIWSLGCVFLEMWTVLKGETLETLDTFLTQNGTNTVLYHHNRAAVTTWCNETIAKSNTVREDLPLDWINGSLQVNPELRWSARKLVACVAIANDRVDNELSFISDCCIVSDDSPMSPTSSRRFSQTFEDTGASSIDACESSSSTSQRLEHVDPSLAHLSGSTLQNSSLHHVTELHDTVKALIPASPDMTTISPRGYSEKEFADVEQMSSRPFSSQAPSQAPSQQMVGSFENSSKAPSIMASHRMPSREENMRLTNLNSKQSDPLRSAYAQGDFHEDIVTSTSPLRYPLESKRQGDVLRYFPLDARHASLDSVSSKPLSLAERGSSAVFDLAKPRSDSQERRLDREPRQNGVHDIDSRFYQRSSASPQVRPKEGSGDNADSAAGSSRGSVLGHLELTMSPEPSASLDGPLEDFHEFFPEVTTATTPETSMKAHWQKYAKLKGHTNAVRTVAFSPDGTLIASGSDDKTIRLWDTVTQEVRHKLVGDPDTLLSGGSFLRGVFSVAFSPDGRQLVSGANDKMLRLWNTVTGSNYSMISQNSDSVRAVAFSPNGELVASSADDEFVKMWYAATGQIYRTLSGHSKRVNTIAFSPDGKLVASGADDKSIRLWNTSTGDCRHKLSGHTSGVLRVGPYSGGVTSVAFSPGSKLVASGGTDKTIRIWDTITGQCHNTLSGHSDWVNAVTFSPDGRLIASGADDKTIRLWDVATGKICHTLTNHSGGTMAKGVYSLAFSPDGKMIASGAADSTVRLWSAMNSASGQGDVRPPKQQGWTTKSLNKSLKKMMLL